MTHILRCLAYSPLALGVFVLLVVAMAAVGKWLKVGRYDNGFGQVEAKRDVPAKDAWHGEGV